GYRLPPNQPHSREPYGRGGLRYSQAGKTSYRAQLRDRASLQRAGILHPIRPQEPEPRLPLIPLRASDYLGALAASERPRTILDEWSAAPARPEIVTRIQRPLPAIPRRGLGHHQFIVPKLFGIIESLPRLEAPDNAQRHQFLFKNAR